MNLSKPQREMLERLRGGETLDLLDNEARWNATWASIPIDDAWALISTGQLKPIAWGTNCTTYTAAPEKGGRD